MKNTDPIQSILLRGINYNMVTTIIEGTIQKPISIVFPFVANLETMEDYNSSIQLAKWIEPNKVCKIKVGLSIISFDSTYEVTSFRENELIVARCNHSAMEFEDTYEFIAKEQTTFLRITDRMKLKGLLSLSEGLLQSNMKREMQANMNRLISILEKT